MVQRVFSLVYKEVRGLHQAAYVLALFTFGSQLLALVRDRLLAHQFGAGIELDLYYTAFRIPDFLYVLFASTLSVYVLIPFIIKRFEERSGHEAQVLLSQIFSLFIIVYSICALVAIIFAPYIVYYFFPGFENESETLVTVIRILLVQPLLLGISSLFGVITQMGQRFILYAMSPLIYNLGIIFGLLFFYPHFGIQGLAYGVVMGALGHVLIQIPFLRGNALTPRFVLSFNWDDIVLICRTSLIRAITLSLHQMVLLGLIGFASLMTVGSVSVFQFAYNLQSVPLAIIGVSYSVAAFPFLAQLFSEKKYEQFGAHITNALRHILFWSLPTIALFIVIRAQFVRVVLGSGAFNWNDTRLTAAILALFILSLSAQAMHLLLVRALYASQNTRLPFWITMCSSSGALLLSYYFYQILSSQGKVYTFIESSMRLQGVSGIEVLALPLGYSGALILHSIVLLLLSQKSIHIKASMLIKPLIYGMLASVVAGYIAYMILTLFAVGLEPNTVLVVFAQGLFAGIGGLSGFILVQYLCRSEELSEIYSALQKKFKKRNVAVPQDEDTFSV